jgi:hypothetical protein
VEAAKQTKKQATRQTQTHKQTSINQPGEQNIKNAANKQPSQQTS